MRNPDWPKLPSGKWRVVKISASPSNLGDTAVFHEWGVDYDEHKGHYGSFSVAICEFPCGSVRGISVGRITFTGEVVHVI